MRLPRLRGALAVGAAGALAAAAWDRTRPARGAVIATRLYAPEAAAAAQRLRGLALALAERGERVTVLTSTPPGMEAPHDPGVEVRSVPALRDESGYVRGYAHYMSVDAPLAVRLLARRRPRVVIAEPPPTTGAVVRAVCALRGIPYAYYAADVWSDASQSIGAPAWVASSLRLVERFALRGARRVIAVSDGVASRVRELGARDVEVVPNGIDTDVFTLEGAPHPGAPAAPYFVYAGTASEWQGAGVFIEALHQVHLTHPEARLVFLGQGSDWENLVAQAAGDERVRFSGLVPPAEAAAWLRGAAAAVVSIRPGLGYDFAYPTKILAALACGTPVVYAGPGPAREDLGAHGLGHACDHEVGAVAEAMCRALADAEAPRREREAARRRAWVVGNRSMRAAMGRAADEILEISS